MYVTDLLRKTIWNALRGIATLMSLELGIAWIKNVDARMRNIN